MHDEISPLSKTQKYNELLDINYFLNLLKNTL